MSAARYAKPSSRRETHAHRDTTGEADVLGDLRPHRIGDDHLVAGREQRAEGDVERVHRAVGDEDVVVGDGGEAVLRAHLVGERGAQLGDAVVRHVVRLAGVQRCDDRLADVCGGREARVTRLEAEHDLAGGLGAEKSLADLHDLAE